MSRLFIPRRPSAVSFGDGVMQLWARPSGDTPTLASLSPKLWWDFSAAAMAWSDTAGTVAATNGGTLARLDDASGNGNHATMATAGAQPLWYSAGYIDTDGVDDRLGIADAGAWSAAQTLIGVVHSQSTTSTVGRMLARGNVNGFVDTAGALRWYNNSTTFQAFAGSNVRTAPVVLSFVRTDDTTATVRINGVDAASFIPSATQQTAVVIGGQTYATVGNPVAVRCWQVALWDSALNATDLATAERLLGAKAGIVLP